MRTTTTIDGRRVRLRLATLADRRMIHDWSYASDVAPLLHLSDAPTRPIDDWCADWEEHYFTGSDPERGRMFVVLDGDTPVGAIAYNDIDERHRVELDVWLDSEANCGRGLGTDAIEALVGYLRAELGVRTFMMQPSARNPRAVRAYEKVGFVRVPATPEEIAAEWGGVDHHDSVLMIREAGPAAVPAPPEDSRGQGGIERLRPGDGLRLRALRFRALADAPEAFGSTLADAEARSADAWEAQARELPTFVWREGGVDLGMVRIAPHDRDRAFAYLISMWVAPEARGRGVGAALVDEVVAWARGRGLRRLYLDVGLHNAAARRLYERTGFVATGATGALPLPRSHLREIEMAIDLRVADAGPAGGAAYAGTAEVSSMVQDGMTDGAGGSALVELPEPSRTGAVSLEETLARRRSVRAFAPDPIPLRSIGQLAWSAQGVTEVATGYRTAPSAGGTLPIEVDLLLHGVPGLEDGVYRYHPAEHALRLRLPGDLREAITASTMNQGFVRDAPVVMVVSAVAARTTPRFGSLTDRLIDMEVGHVGQNVSLQAVALGLGSVVVVAFREAELAAALQLAEGERPVYLMPVGRDG